ncbi:hypothetical protein JHK87_047049 [Glycine soja]|nr:hypothetical protein JHK87_047049 [Glycine soja]
MDIGTYGYPTPAVKKIESYYDVPEGVDIRGRYDAEFAKILTKDALKFVADLQREFRNHIKYALECRREAKKKYNEGALPEFDPATRYIREQEWVCAPVPPAVADRKVEITGPVDRKMVINALNSGAKVFMADFEDALSPGWENLMRGQVNLKDAVAGTISLHDKARNRVYKLNDQTAKLFVRPRGWHLPEAHILIDGEPATGCLVDFGLYFYHNYSAFRRTQAQIPIKEDPVANEVALELVRKDKLREVKAGHDGTWAAHPGLIPACMEIFNNNMGNASNQIDTVKREDGANITEQDLLQIPRGARTMEGLRLNTRVGIQYVAAWLTGSGSVPLYNLMEDAATAEISRVQNWQWLKYGVELNGDGLGVKVNKELFGRVVEEEMARIEKEVGTEKFKKGMYKEACKIFTRQCTSPTLDDFLTLDAYNYIVVHHPRETSKL